MSKQYILEDLGSSNYQLRKPITFDVVRPRRIVIEKNTAIKDMKTVTEEEVWEDKLSRLYSKDSSILPYILKYPIKIGNWYLWRYGRTLKEVVSDMRKSLIEMYKDFRDFDSGKMDKKEYEVINEGGNIYYHTKSYVIGCNAKAYKAFLYSHIKE